MHGAVLAEHVICLFAYNYMSPLSYVLPPADLNNSGNDVNHCLSRPCQALKENAGQWHMCTWVSKSHWRGGGVVGWIESTDSCARRAGADPLSMLF